MPARRKKRSKAQLPENPGPTIEKVRQGVIERGVALRDLRESLASIPRSKAQLLENPGPTRAKIEAELLKRRQALRGGEVQMSLAEMFRQQRRQK